MRKVRLIAIIVCVIFLALLFVSLLTTRKSAPVTFVSHGRSCSDDGSVSYLVTVTNRTTEPINVEVMRNNAPTGVLGYAFRVHTTMQATSVWHAALYPPPEGVPWSASVRYLRRTGLSRHAFGKSVRGFGFPSPNRSGRLRRHWRLRDDNTA